MLKAPPKGGGSRRQAAERRRSIGDPNVGSAVAATLQEEDPDLFDDLMNSSSTTTTATTTSQSTAPPSQVQNQSTGNGDVLDILDLFDPLSFHNTSQQNQNGDQPVKAADLLVPTERQHRRAHSQIVFSKTNFFQEPSSDFGNPFGDVAFNGDDSWGNPFGSPDDETEGANSGGFMIQVTETEKEGRKESKGKGEKKKKKKKKKKKEEKEESESESSTSSSESSEADSSDDDERNQHRERRSKKEKKRKKSKRKEEEEEEKKRRESAVQKDLPPPPASQRGHSRSMIGVPNNVQHRPPPPPGPPPPSTLSQKKKEQEEFAAKVQSKLYVDVDLDVLEFMHRGTAFLKYGKHGYPHFRFFQLSDDNQRLVWFSKSKKMKATQIELSNVTNIVMGQTTANFKRHRAPELVKSSFSIIYDNGKKTLDLISKDPNEYKIWVDGLKSLVEKCRHQDFLSLADLKEHKLHIPIRRGRRSSFSILQAAGIPTDPELDDPTRSAAAQKDPKGINVKDLKLKANDVRQRYNKLKVKSIDKISSSYHANNMQNILGDVEKSLERISTWFNGGQYALCDDEVWRASVDLESVENMMAALNVK